MIRKTSYHSGYNSIYPGIYQPSFSKEQELIKIKSSRPPVNIIEFPDCYEIEMPAPGFNKDDFIIKSQGCSLIIGVIRKKNETLENAQYRQHGFNYRHISRSVDLPADADTEFGTAEYKNGVLSIYLYKTSFPVQNHQNFIIVY
jgi:HSP20 family protein